LSNDSIAFIGGGNMARSLISGLTGAGMDPDSITASDPVPEQRAQLDELGIRTTSDNNDAIDGAAVVVLAVKPQVLGEVLKGLERLGPDQLLLSIAAGVPISAMAAWTRAAQPIIRAMPNTPALLGVGVTALHANPMVGEVDRNRAERILSTAGQTLWVDNEAKLDAVTAVSGSGPAYFFYLMESMIEAGIEQGLDAETATTLTLETAHGAALMARERTHAPRELRANVTSPGGTTEAALATLEAAGAKDIIKRALASAQIRSRELAEEFGKS
jgi:pyrroline-5-carboxylate reductase